MGNRIMTLVLLMTVLGLLLPLTQGYLSTENAFTVDNLVRLEMSSE